AASSDRPGATAFSTASLPCHIAATARDDTAALRVKSRIAEAGIVLVPLASVEPLRTGTVRGPALKRLAPLPALPGTSGRGRYLDLPTPLAARQARYSDC